MHIVRHILIGLLLAGCAGSVFAARIDVPQDYATLQAALDAAVDFDEIVIACGEYEWEGVVCTKHVLIRSETEEFDCVRINGLGGASILSYDPSTPGTMAFTGITFSNQRDNESTQGGAILADDRFIATNCRFTECSAGFGGAIWARGDVVLEDCRFDGNQAREGAVLALYGQDLNCTFRRCDIQSNHSDNYAVVFVDAQDLVFRGSTALTIEECLFRENSSGGSLLRTSGHLDVDIRSSTIVQNTIYNDDPIIYFYTPPDQNQIDTLTIEWTTIADNHQGAASSPVIGARGEIAYDSLLIEGVIIARNNGYAIETGDDYGEELNTNITCSDIWGNIGGDWTGSIAGQAGLNDNISANPRFCHPHVGDYTLAADSPCAPAAGCGMGALGVGCDSSIGYAYLVPDDYATVAEALDVAFDGDTVVLSCGTYYEHGLVMRAGVTLRSHTGLANCATLDANYAGRILTCSGTEAGTRIEGLTFRHGQAVSGGGLHASTPDLTLDDCEFVSNVATSSSFAGAGLYADHCAVDVSRCLFWQNEVTTAASNGGAIMAWYSDLDVSDSRFLSNRAEGGAAISALYAPGVTLSGSTFHDNGVSPGIVQGAVLQYFGAGNPSVVDCTVGYSPGDLGTDFSVYPFIGTGGVLTVSSCIFVGNPGDVFSPINADAQTPVIDCSNFYGYEDGNWLGSYAHLETQNDNMSVDPLFCDEPAADLRLDPLSPCLDVSGCGTIGAWDSPCGTPVAQPSGVSVDYGAGGNTVDWSATRDPGAYYRVYRDDHAGFTPSEANLIAEVPGPPWLDDAGGYADHYLVSAYNVWDEESGATAPDAVSDVATPGRVILHAAHPNPFNPSTTIAFSLPTTMDVRLDVYSPLGRHVRTLVDGRRPAGRQTAVWDGRDGSGREVASGVYVYRLKTAEGSVGKKFTLMK